MLNTILSYFTEGFTYAALEICEVNGEECYYLLEVKKSKTEIIITKKSTLSHLEELSKAIQKDIPLFLSVNTSQILTKKIPITGNTNPEATVNTAFPNLDLSNFYYEIIQLSENPIVTIAKKEYVDAILKKINEIKIPLIRFSLGMNSMGNIASYIDEDRILGSNFQLTIQENLITDLKFLSKSEEHQYELNGLSVDNTHLIPFANIVGYLNQNSNVNNFNSLCDAYIWEYKNSRIFTTVLKSSLIFFIGLLLVNFFFFTHYHTTVENLSTVIEANSSQKNSLNTLNASVTKKQHRLEVLNAFTNSKSTYYLDELANKVPNNILLNEIKYQPLLKPVRDSKPIELEERTILVSGISYDGNEFSLWLEKLENQEWISLVKTLDYDYVSKETSHFVIKIELNENK